MTKAQESAISQIEQIAREHFTSSLFIAEGEAVGVENPDNHSDVICTYHGGYTTSIGLAQLALMKVYSKEFDQSTDSGQTTP